MVELLRAQPRRVRRLLVLAGRAAGEAEALAGEIVLVVTRVELEALGAVISA